MLSSRISVPHHKEMIVLGHPIDPVDCWDWYLCLSDPCCWWTVAWGGQDVNVYMDSVEAELDGTMQVSFQSVLQPVHLHFSIPLWQILDNINHSDSCNWKSMPSTRLLKLDLYAFSFCNAAWQEVDLAIAADIGTLQRLPGIVGDGKSLPSLQYCTISGEPGFARHILCTSYRTPLPFHDHTVLVWFSSLFVFKKPPYNIAPSTLAFLHSELRI